MNKKTYLLQLSFSIFMFLIIQFGYYNYWYQDISCGHCDLLPNVYLNYKDVLTSIYGVFMLLPFALTLFFHKENKRYVYITLISLLLLIIIYSIL